MSPFCESPGGRSLRALEPVDKVDRLSRTCKHVLEGLQPAASHSLCSHACRLSSVFSEAHVPGKNRFYFIPSSADDGTLRGSCTKSEAFLLFRQAEAPGDRSLRALFVSAQPSVTQTAACQGWKVMAAGAARAVSQLAMRRRAGFPVSSAGGVKAAGEPERLHTVRRVLSPRVRV